MMTALELLKMVQESGLSQREQLEALAALSDAPPQDYAPLMKLPIQNQLPSYRLGSDGIGDVLSGWNYGVAAPVIGQETVADSSLGQILLGE